MRSNRASWTKKALVAIWAIIPTAASAEALVIGDGFQLTAEDVSYEIQFQPEQARRRFVQDPESLKSLIDDMYRREALASVATRFELSDLEQYRIDRGRKEALVGIAIDRKAAEILAAAPDFSERAYERYATHSDQFLVPEAVHVRHILFLVGDPEKKAEQRKRADQMLAAVRSGADFKQTVAGWLNDSAANAKSGDLGWVERGKTVPAFEQAAFGLVRPGDVSEVIETKYGYHVIQLEARRSKRVKDFAEVRAQLIDAARADYLRQELAKWKAQLTDVNKAEVNVKAINAFLAETLKLPTTEETKSVPDDNGAEGSLKP